MKMLLAISAVVGMVMGEEGCSCPNFVHSSGNGMVVLNEGQYQEQKVPPCCEDLARQKKMIQDHGLIFQDDGVTPSKHTPGSPCGSLTSCGSCTTLAFCRWHEGLPRKGGTYSGTNACVDETAVKEGEELEYVQRCSDRAGMLFGMAEVRDQKEWKETGHWTMPQVSEAAKTATGKELHAVVTAVDDSQWPHNFDEYLPPYGCDRVNPGALKAKYPTGMPGCGDYVNEGMSFKSGHMTTDIVSDPRLPVETHIPHYPLGANSQLPDHLVEGGDWSLPQPNAPWVKPDFNKNGCLGGPCDEMTQHACNGLACSHTVKHGEKYHDKVKGSEYERENGHEDLKKEDHAVHQERSAAAE